MSASHWAQIAQKVAAEINQLIADLESGKRGHIQSVGATLLGILQKAELSYQALVHHGRVGVSSCNREGSMLCADNVHQLLTRFTEKGWNPLEAASALATEIGDSASAAFERQKNMQMIESGGGLLPKLHVEEIQILTIAGSHTTTVLRLIDSAEREQYRTMRLRIIIHLHCR